MLLFENATDKTVHTGYYLPKAEIKDYNSINNGENVFDQPIKSYIKLHEDIKKITIDQGDTSTTSCLLDYPHFKEYYKMIAIDLSK